MNLCVSPCLGCITIPKMNILGIVVSNLRSPFSGLPEIILLETIKTKKYFLYFILLNHKLCIGA